jgi:hypothetical protein
MSDKKISIGISSDYAVLETRKSAFYYGYEVVRCTVCGEVHSGGCPNHEDAEQEWCFVAGEGDGRFVVPYSKLIEFADDTPDQCDARECLMIGIGIAVDGLLGDR